MLGQWDEGMVRSKPNPRSRRTAILAEEGKHSVWLYLTDAGESTPARDAFVRSLVPPISRAELSGYKDSGGPPPICEGFANPDSSSPDLSGKIQLRWSRDGESVAIVVDQAPLAMIVAGSPRGYSRAILRSGPWGEPWNEELFVRTFSDVG